MSIDIEALLLLAESFRISKWELDNIIWHERSTNPEVLLQFLRRIEYLRTIENPTIEIKQELTALEELADDMDQDSCEELFDQNDETVRHQFIERLARQGALETLCNNAISIDTMEQMCKLAPNDFILTAKRSQDLINSIQELVIQGETLSNDVAGA
jgi:hypothetical protein